MKRLLAFTLITFLFSTSLQLSAQEVSPPPPPPPPVAPIPPSPPSPGNLKSEEIIIKRNGDKDVNLNIQITGDKVIVNGKPLMEFNEDGVTINKKKIIVKEGDNITFWENPDDPVTLNFNNFRDSKRTNEKYTFLGVSTGADKQGALIEEVTKDSPAEKAGLQKGDIITKVGSEEIATPDDLSKAIRSKKPNEVVKISFLRNDKKKSTKATLSERRESSQVWGFSSPNGNFKKLIIPYSNPKDNYGFGNDWYNQFRGNGDFNFLADSLQFNGNFDFRGPRKKLGLKIQDTEDESGVKVLEVEDSSAAQLAGLQKGDIITQIGEDKVSNTDEMREELADNRDKKAYTIKALRNGKEMNFEIKFPKKLKTANL